MKYTIHYFVWSMGIVTVWCCLPSRMHGIYTPQTCKIIHFRKTGESNFRPFFSVSPILLCSLSLSFARSRCLSSPNFCSTQTFQSFQSLCLCDTNAFRFRWKRGAAATVKYQCNFLSFDRENKTMQMKQNKRTMYMCGRETKSGSQNPNQPVSNWRQLKDHQTK